MTTKILQRWSRFSLILGLAALALPVRAQTIPNTPVNLTASAQSSFQINLSWTDTSANEDGFKVERSLDGTSFTQIAQVLANTTNYLNTGLFPGTNYYYRVYAYNSAGNSAYTDVASAQTPTSPCSLSVVGWGDDTEGKIDIPSELTNGVVAISAGYNISVALKSDGTVVGWGDYDATPPTGLTGVVAISACYFHSLALENDGTVVGWGYNAYGETTPPTGLTGVVAVATGLYHSLALKNDGTVVAWGDDTHGQTDVPTGLTGVVAISAGYYHCLALKSDGTVVAWGAGETNNPNGYDYGQSIVPVGLSNVVAISAGYYHSLALKSDGTIVGWNSNYYNESTPPAGLTGVVAISAGYYFNLALKSDGTVVGWGNNSYGESTPPIGLTGIEAIAAGIYHSLALATSPSPPSGFSTTVVAPNEIDLSWNEYSSGAEGFEIERAPDVGGVPGGWAQIATVDASVTSYSDMTVTANTPYWYRVQAQNSCSDSPYAIARVVYSILDDTWLSGTRTVQNLPTSSAWFTSGYGSLNAVPGAMTLTVGSSVLIVTYFTPINGSPPITLNVGDTLTASISFIFNGLPTASSSSQGFRIGLFDFADGSNSPLRVSSDGMSSSSQGLNVAGYALFQKMYTSFSDSTPIDIRKRTNLPDAGLLSSSGDFTSLANGGDTNAIPGFANLTPYILQFVLKRTSLSSMDITMSWSNQVTGKILTVSTTDSAASNFSFDGIGFRPQNTAQAAVSNVFTEVKIAVTSAPIAPAIVTQPQNVNVSSGQNATFTVAPNGTLPLSYQWYFNTNTPVANATNATLTLTNVQGANAGGYSVVITNSYGSITSMVATLMADVPPSISTQPVDLTVIPGQSATFTVVADGSQPLYYQWYYNTNTPLNGATSPTLTLTNMQPGDVGSYSVVVSNTAGSVTSSYAILNVNTNPVSPVFILQPVSVTARESSNGVFFTAAAVGTQPITYQWNFNGTPIPDATSNTLNLAAIQLSDGGNYTIIAANSVGSTTSSVAVLTVVPIVPPLPVIPTTQFLITDYGAVGDGVTDNTTAIQNTINAASAAGGGTVVVPTGGGSSTYLCGPITLASEINLQINSGATLQMLPYGTWPGTSTFINGVGLHDVEISGSGTIDGQGAPWWAAYIAHNIGRPYFINFSSSCSNILIQNVTMQNPPTFHMMLKGGNVNLTIRGITINTSGNSPNTDGMDLASTHVLIQNCFISDGDDNIEIGGSADPAADVTVTNCTFGTGHGVSIGSDIQGGVHDLTVINCSFTGTDNGIRMKSDNDRGGLVQNLLYCNLTMTNVGYPILIYSYYNEYGTPNSITPQIAMAQPSTPVNPATPIWNNIVISNVTATATTGSKIAGIIWGRPEMPATNFKLCNVTIAAPTKTFDIYNAQGIQIIDSPLNAPNTTTNTLTLYNAQVTLTNSTAVTNLVTLGGLSVPPVNNVLAFYNTMASITQTGMLGSGPITLGGSSLMFPQNLTLPSSNVVNFAVGTNRTMIAVSNNLVLNATLNITAADGFDAGSYTLFIYGGSLGGIPILGDTPVGYPCSINTNTVGLVTLTVGCPTITLSPATLTDGNFGISYSNTIAASPGVGTYTYAVTSGSLPGGLSLTTNGTLTGIPLALGTNTFTVTATDVSGCTGGQSYSMAVTCPTITLSPATLANGNIGISYSNTIAAIPGVGTYTYAVTGGSLPSGLSLTTNGALTGIPFALCTNTFTVTATDAYDCPGSTNYTVAITGSGNLLDTNKPTVIITSPGNRATVTSASIAVSGTAKDATGTPNTGVALVLISVNGGSQRLAATTNQFQNWSVTNVQLNPGWNTVAAQSVDFRDNVSAIRTDSYFYSDLQPLTILTTGSGTVKPNLNTSNLVVTKTYTVTAFPGSNYLFTNWTALVGIGPAIVATNTPKYTFVMQSNLTLIANFVSNPFLGAGGTYYGLFSDPVGAVSHQTAGYIQFKVNPGQTSCKPSFNGFMYVQGERVPFSGIFDPDMSGTGHLGKVATRKRSGVVMDTFDIVADLDLVSGTVITGAVTSLSNNWVSTFEANRNVYAARADAPMAGSYTMVLQPTRVSGEPGGYGYFCMNLTTNGLMKPMAGRIGDGFKPKVTAVGTSGAPTNKVPFYASAYKEADGSFGGSVWGWLYFTNGVVGGQLTVNKLVGVPTAVWPTYAAGFTNTITVQGSGFTNTLVPRLNFTGNEGLISFEDGILGGSAAFANFMLDPLSSRVTFWKGLNPNKISLSLKPTGQMMGSFLITPGDTSSKRACEGAILQNVNQGYGVFPTGAGTDTTSGSVTVER